MKELIQVWLLGYGRNEKEIEKIWSFSLSISSISKQRGVTQSNWSAVKLVGVDEVSTTFLSWSNTWLFFTYYMTETDWHEFC